MTTAAAFDKLAERYDDQWTNSSIGRLQRTAVWREIDPLFRCGDHILDIGCGTGEDARHLMDSGVHLTAMDGSPEMVRIACARGVGARILAIEDLDQLSAPFGGAISDFGALNCVADLPRFGSALARLISPGGHVALCTMGRFCLWETVYYGARLQPGKALRRLAQSGVASSIGPRIFYPSVRQVQAAMRPGFELIRWMGIGVAVPPSYVTGHSSQTLTRAAAFDRFAAHWPILRALSDHRLLIFQRK